MLVLMVPAFIYLWTWVQTDEQRQGLLAAAVFLGGICLVELIGFAPPMVKVSPERVMVRGEFQARQSMKRSDLAYIFRGQGLMNVNIGRRIPGYFLVTLDDTPQIMISALDFSAEGMTELAKRLSVPIKGDFSADVK